MRERQKETDRPAFGMREDASHPRDANLVVLLLSYY